MGPGAVPIAGHGFRVEGDDHTEVLGDSLKQVAGHPQVVPHLDPQARPHLELPLRGGGGKGKPQVIITHHGANRIGRIPVHSFELYIKSIP